MPLLRISSFNITFSVVMLRDLGNTSFADTSVAQSSRIIILQLDDFLSREINLQIGWFTSFLEY